MELSPKDMPKEKWTSKAHWPDTRIEILDLRHEKNLSFLSSYVTLREIKM